MSNIHRQIMTLSLLTAVLMAMAVCWIAGCAKKSGREAVPETRDTLTVISDTLSKTYNTLSETSDTLPEIPNALTDTRDGKVYKTTTIGKHTWMAKNLNYATDSGSWCYNDSLSYCKQYGRLYDWNTATTVCPSGWHLPSRAEWDQLAESVGGRKTEYRWPDWHVWEDAGKKLKSTSGWYDLDGNNSGNGTDVYGFSALPGGLRDSDGSYYNADNYGYWWMAMKDVGSNEYFRYMGYDYDGVGEYNHNKRFGFSVRCMLDN